MKILKMGIELVFTHTQKCHVAHYTENQKNFSSWSRSEISIKISNHSAEKKNISSTTASTVSEALYLTPGPSYEPLNRISLWTLHFFSVSKWEKLYRQFRFHNEEVLIHSNSKHSRQARSIHGNVISFHIAGLMKRITEFENQEAFISGRFSHCKRKSYWDHSTLIKWHPL